MPVRISRLFRLLMFALFCSTASLAQEGIVRRLDSFYSAGAVHGHFMGNVRITVNDSVLYQRSFGYQDIDRKIPNSDSSAFAMASVTKIFTATAILQLRQQGLLGLDDSFAHYFSAFPFSSVTIRQLLSHTSGLPAYELFDSLAAALPDKVFGNDDVIPALRLWSRPLHSLPGQGYYYSSMNYCLLAQLIEKLSGMDLAAYFDKYIFTPAGMHHSYLENYSSVKDNPNRTINYELKSEKASQLSNVYVIPRHHRMVYNYGGFVGQGGLVSTASDLSLFDHAYFSGKLISPASVMDAITPTLLSSGRPVVASTLLGSGIAGYGLGWSVGIHPLLSRIVWHTGGRPGVKTMYLHLLNKNITVFILENSRSAESIDALAAQTLNILNGEPVFLVR